MISCGLAGNYGFNCPYGIYLFTLVPATEGRAIFASSLRTKNRCFGLTAVKGGLEAVLWSGVQSRSGRKVVRFAQHDTQVRLFSVHVHERIVWRNAGSLGSGAPSLRTTEV